MLRRGYYSANTDSEMAEMLLVRKLSPFLYQGCLVQVGNGIERDPVGRQFEPYR